MTSPSCTAAIGPPRTDSGATWPAMKPCVAPLKRPSVSSATCSPSPTPLSAAVTASISRMPGPPAGPSLRMTMTSPRSIVPRDDGGHRRLLALEHAGRSLVVAALVAGRASRRSRRARGCRAGSRGRRVALIGSSSGPDDLLARGLPRLAGVLADRAAGDGDRVLVQQAGLEQPLGDERHAAGRVEVVGDVAAAGLEVAQQRRLLGDAVEVVDVELDAGFTCDGQQVQDAVRRAATRGDRGDRVLQRLLRDDVARRAGRVRGCP